MGWRGKDRHPESDCDPVPSFHRPSKISVSFLKIGKLHAYETLKKKDVIPAAVQIIFLDNALNVGISM